jgi:hypothetical protein
LTPVFLATLISAQPVVFVDVEPDDGIRDALLVRLVEEGFSLAPRSELAGVDVVVRRGDRGWQVEAVGTDRQLYEIAAEGSVGLQRLELLHRAVAAAEEVKPRPGVEPANSPPSPRVQVVFADAPTTAAAQAELTAGIVGALLEADVVVTSADVAHDGVVCAWASARGSAATVAMTPDECSQHAAALDGASWEAAQAVSTRIAADVVQRAPWAAQPEPEPAPEPEPEPATDTERPPRLDVAPQPAAPPPRPRRGMVRVGARGGLVGRLQPVDAALGADVRLGSTRGPAGWIDLQIWPTRATGHPGASSLRIVEVVPALGFGWRFVPHPRVALDPGLLLGLDVHAYRSDVDRGRRTDASIEAAFGVAFDIVAGLELGVQVRGGRSARARTHDILGTEVWHRDAWRVAAFVEVAYAFEFGRSRP